MREDGNLEFSIFNAHANGLLHVKTSSDISYKLLDTVAGLISQAASEPKGAVVVTPSGITIDFIPYEK